VKKISYLSKALVFLVLGTLVVVALPVQLSALTARKTGTTAVTSIWTCPADGNVTGIHLACCGDGGWTVTRAGIVTSGPLGGADLKMADCSRCSRISLS
jgi:hypothetical protein